MPRPANAASTYTAVSIVQSYAARSRCRLPYAYPRTTPSTSTTSHGERSMVFAILAAISSAVGGTSSNEIDVPSTNGP